MSKLHETTTRPIPPNLRPAAIMVRVGLPACAAAIALVLLGYFPTRSVAGAAGVLAMLVGIGVALIGAWAGSLPTLLYLRKPPREHLTGILLGLGVRFGVTIALTLAVWLCSIVPETPMLLWVGIAQSIILGLDVIGLASLLKRAAKEAA